MSDTSNNPLLQLSDLPHYAPDFSKIEEGHYLPAIEASIEIARGNIDAIKENTDTPNFENTIVALETASEILGQATSVFYNQLSVNSSDEFHKLAEKIGPLTANFSDDVSLDAHLFARVKEVYDRKEDLGLTAEQTMLLDETYMDFVRGGALLDDEGKERLRKINERKTVLSPLFSNNVRKSTEAYEMVIDNEDDLKGLPDSIIEGAKHEAESRDYEGKWVFTLDAPSFIPFVQYADNRALREELWRAYTSRGWGGEFDNSDVILETVSLRHERANLLGYETHAHYVLEKRMAEIPATVDEFLSTLQGSYKAAAQRDLQALKDFAKEHDDQDDIQPWDIMYYSEKLKKQLFNLSTEELRPYFPLMDVLEGVFEHFSKLFHLRFKKVDTYPVWHEDVVVYEVSDLTDGSFVGVLYGDFYPRKGKRSGAWKTSYRDQGLFNNKSERPIISIVCNFPKPTDDTPSLLTHDDVTTLFHEMGHAVHGLLSKITYRSLAGTNVLWDFVELPSQVQENWAFTKETLDMFTKHYQTGETIPEELVKKLNDAKNFMTGWAGLRQVNFAKLDMAWHSQDPSGISDVAAFEDAETAETSLFPRLSGPFSASFAHIFAGGYAAGYYSYKWAEVLDADAFELFEERGLYDQPTAESFKNEVLSRGGSEHPRILYRRFRGRDADEAALLRREGLLNSEERAA